MPGKMTASDKWMTKGLSKAQKAKWMGQPPSERKRLVAGYKKGIASERKRVNKQIAEDKRQGRVVRQKVKKRKKPVKRGIDWSK